MFSFGSSSRFLCYQTYHNADEIHTNTQIRTSLFLQRLAYKISSFLSKARAKLRVWKKQKRIRHLKFVPFVVVVLVSLFPQKMHGLCSPLVTAFIKKLWWRLTGRELFQEGLCFCGSGSPAAAGGRQSAREGSWSMGTRQPKASRLAKTFQSQICPGWDTAGGGDVLFVWNSAEKGKRLGGRMVRKKFLALFMS